MPVTDPTIAPTKTNPVTEPVEAPWQEEFTDPAEICPQQVREVSSPDIAP